MLIKDLFKYTRPDGGIDVSPVQPAVEYEPMYRVIADECKLVTIDGEKLYSCIDTTIKDGWYEVDDPNIVPGREANV